MGKGTPINNIRKQQDNSQLVQSILDGMEQGDTPDMAVAGQQMPPQQMQQTQPPQNMTNSGQMQAPQQYEDQQQQYYDEDYYPEGEEGFQGQYMELPPMSTMDRIMYSVKLPLLVTVLVFISNFNVLDKTIMNYVPKTIGGSGLNMLGIMFKSVLMGVIFYAVFTFVL